MIGSTLYGGALSKDGELETVVMRAGMFDDHESTAEVDCSGGRLSAV
jgi:hypothetical protein